MELHRARAEASAGRRGGRHPPGGPGRSRGWSSGGSNPSRRANATAPRTRCWASSIGTSKARAISLGDRRCSRVSNSDRTHAAPLLGAPLRVLASPGAAFRDRKGLTLPPPAPGGPVSEPSPPPLPVGWLGFGAVAPTEPRLAVSGQSRRFFAALMPRSASSPVRAQTSWSAGFFGSIRWHPPRDGVWRWPANGRRPSACFLSTPSCR